MPLTRGVVAGRAVIERRTLQVGDLQAEKEEYPEGSEFARRLDYRTILVVPLIRADEAIGAILIRRTEVRPFTDRQVDLLKTFADQAVIAIENTRLFEAEQARTKELQESLEYQTATSEVLNVINRSPSQLQSVFEAIAIKALDLCAGKTSGVYRFDGEFIHLATTHSLSHESAAQLRQSYPLRPSRGGTVARAILTRTTVYIPNVFNDPEYELRGLAEAMGYLSILSVPMLHEGKPLGAINIASTEVDAFSDKQIEILKTFADQAVIAIENTRLFEAEQASKREL
jgi:two-component system, NtrC family, sensor kinase